MAVDAGLLYGKDLLVVSATASGKTFIGEMAGIKNSWRDEASSSSWSRLWRLPSRNTSVSTSGTGTFAEVGIMIGKSRINLPRTVRPETGIPVPR